MRDGMRTVEFNSTTEAESYLRSDEIPTSSCKFYLEIVEVSYYIYYLSAM